MSEAVLNVAVVGAGYWGKNLVRNFATAQRCSLKYVCDIISLRFGDIVIPKIPGGEPLSLECEHFLECVLENRPVRSDGADGLRVVQVLEAGQQSLRNHGASVNPGEF